MIFLALKIKDFEREGVSFIGGMVMKYVRTFREHTGPVAGDSNMMMPPDQANETSFLAGPSQDEFHDEQQKEEKRQVL